MREHWKFNIFLIPCLIVQQREFKRDVKAPAPHYIHSSAPTGERSSHCWRDYGSSGCLMSHTSLFVLHSSLCVFTRGNMKTVILALLVLLAFNHSEFTCWLDFCLKLKLQHKLIQKDWRQLCFPRWSSPVLLWRHSQVLSRPCGDLFWSKTSLCQCHYYCWIQ